MKYTCSLIAVADMEKSKQFYHDVLGMNVVADFGANVTLDGGLVLQTLDTWKSFIRKDKVTYHRLCRWFDLAPPGLSNSSLVLHCKSLSDRLQRHIKALSNAIAVTSTMRSNLKV